MTALRAKYIRDLTIRGRAQRTQRAYTRYVSELARYYQRTPELISYEEVTNWLYHLIKERQLSASSVNVAVNAVRFLYGITLGRNTEALSASVPHMKHQSLGIESSSVLASSRLQTGVLPFLTTYFGPRTECAGFDGVICRTTKKSYNIRTAASFSLTVGLDPGKSSIQAATWNGRTDV